MRNGAPLSRLVPLGAHLSGRDRCHHKVLTRGHVIVAGHDPTALWVIATTSSLVSVLGDWSDAGEHIHSERFCGNWISSSTHSVSAKLNFVRDLHAFHAIKFIRIRSFFVLLIGRFVFLEQHGCLSNIFQTSRTSSLRPPGSGFSLQYHKFR